MNSPENQGRSEPFLVTESAQDRAARVERISESVSRGAYQVAAGDVADAVVAFFRRDFGLAESGNPDFDDNSC
ncbi:MAG: hypothetical protein GY720_18625 [bacterium]|nr:hypothetical protein [bacterium]